MSGNPTSSVVNNDNLADNFEKAFQACHACLTHPEGYLRTDHEETRATADLCMNNFLDAARQLEVFFLKKRLLLCRDKPENILKEEIENIEAEIERKNQTLIRHRDRLKQWQQTMADVGKSSDMTVAPQTPLMPTSNLNHSLARVVATPTPPPVTVTSMSVPTRGRGGGRGSRGGYGRSPGRATPTNQDSSSGPLAHLEHTTSQVGR